MILYIDTTNSLKTIIEINDMRFVQNYSSPREQNTLLFIDRVLKDNNVNLNDITSIKVNPGPGSFTGTRVGVTIANTLAQSLNIPINGKNHQSMSTTKILPILQNQKQLESLLNNYDKMKVLVVGVPVHGSITIQSLKKPTLKLLSSIRLKMVINGL